jgi:hypothetical protein
MASIRNAQEWLCYVEYSLSQVWWQRQANISRESLLDNDDITHDIQYAPGSIEMTPRWMHVDELLLAHSSHNMEDTVASTAHKLMVELNSTIGSELSNTTDFFNDCVRYRYLLLEHVIASFISLTKVCARDRYVDANQLANNVVEFIPTHTHTHTHTHTLSLSLSL